MHDEHDPVIPHPVRHDWSSMVIDLVSSLLDRQEQDVAQKKEGHGQKIDDHQWQAAEQYDPRKPK